MTTYSTKIHGPAATAPTTTGKVAKCKNCGIQWQIQSQVNTDAMRCNFCNASSEAITILTESNNYPQTKVIRGL